MFDNKIEELVKYMYKKISYVNLKRLIELLDLFPQNKKYKGTSCCDLNYKNKNIRIDENHIHLLSKIADAIFLSPIDVIDLWIHDMLFINLPTDIINIPDRKLILINMAGSNLLEKQYSIVNNKGTVFIVTYSDKDPHLCVLKIEGSKVSFKDCYDFLKFTVDMTDEIRISGMHSQKLGEICLRQFGNTKEEDIFLKEMEKKNGFLREMKERHAEMMDYIQHCREEETRYAKLRNTKKIVQLATGISNRGYKALYNKVIRTHYPNLQEFALASYLKKLRYISDINFYPELMVKILYELRIINTSLVSVIDALEKFKKGEQDE